MDEMRKMRIVLTLVLSQILLSSVLLGGTMATWQDITNGDLVGVKVGDWVKYSVSRLGQPHAWVPPPIERAEWIRVDVLGISGTTITVNETIHLADGSERIKTFPSDIKMGLTETYIVPANLSAGDEFFLIFTEVAINSTVSGTYGGVVREVNLLNRSYFVSHFEYVYNYSEEYCWDKKSGFLLERTFRSYALGFENTSMSTLSLAIVDTNMWKMDRKLQSRGSQSGLLVVAGLFIVAMVVITVTKLSKNKLKERRFMKNDQNQSLSLS
jgi:hypothetical protein